VYYEGLFRANLPVKSFLCMLVIRLPLYTLELCCGYALYGVAAIPYSWNITVTTRLWLRCCSLPSRWQALIVDTVVDILVVVGWSLLAVSGLLCTSKWRRRFCGCRRWFDLVDVFQERLVENVGLLLLSTYSSNSTSFYSLIFRWHVMQVYGTFLY